MPRGEGYPQDAHGEGFSVPVCFSKAWWGQQEARGPPKLLESGLRFVCSYFLILRLRSGAASSPPPGAAASPKSCEPDRYSVWR